MDGAPRSDALAPDALHDLLDALWPPRCLLCGASRPDGQPCGEHDPSLLEPVPRCGRCASRLPAGLPDGQRCAACVRRPPGFTHALCVGDYGPGEPLRPWLLALKHGGRRDLARPLGQALGARLAEEVGGREELLVPVPLHPLRRLERGHDQARLLAREAGRAAGCTWRPLLVRRRWTEPQGTPGAGSRRTAVAGAFRPRRGAARVLRGRAVWLVDDVLTSGATLSECARVLRRAGARSVGALVVARALPGG